MKKLKLMVGMLAIVMAAVLLPNTEVFAEKKQKVIQTKINTSGIKKMKNSDKKGEILEEAESPTCYAWIQGKDNDDVESLHVTKDGKTIKTVNLKSLVEQALRPKDKDVICFYHLTCIEDTFYVTGAMGQKGDYDGIGSGARNVVHFLVSTKDGSKATVKKISEPIMPYTKLGGLWFFNVGWNLYYFKGKYIGAADTIYESFADEKCKKSLGYRYYVTKDLTTWTPVKIKPFSEQPEEDEYNLDYLVIELSGANSEYLIFKEVIDRYRVIPVFSTYLYTYTTDLKNYKKLTSLNKKIKSSGDYEIGAQLTFSNIGKGGRLAFRDNQKYVQHESGYGVNGQCKDFSILYSKGTNDFEKIFRWDGEWSMYSASWSDRNLCCYVCDDDNTKKNSVYIADLKKGTCEKYLTNLSASKVSCWWGTKAGWDYGIYDGRYLLVTKNSGRTVYKIDTGKKNINRVDCAGKNLVLLTDNGYDYYIPISTVQNAIKKK